MTMADAIRLVALAQAVIDAKDWRETFEQNEGDEHAIVQFDDIDLKASVDSGSAQGFDGSLRMPRDLAIEMMKWLEERATAELGQLRKPHRRRITR